MVNEGELIAAVGVFLLHYTVSRLLTGLSLTMEVDDCLIGGKSVEEVITELEEFLDRFWMQNIKLTRQKLQFGCKVIFTGMKLGGEDGTS